MRNSYEMKSLLINANNPAEPHRVIWFYCSSRTTEESRVFSIDRAVVHSPAWPPEQLPICTGSKLQCREPSTIELAKIVSSLSSR
ncbi:hypothetical protein PV325_001056 [Microctonus aethiopoides]|nr:hypothetical protein PV325_001056 [Microctonus aethiopoides]